MATIPVELGMNGLPRLSSGTLGSLSASVHRPGYSREDTGVGQVHLGVGAFMRAHVAYYNDEAMNVAGGDWGIAGVSLRRPNVRDQLSPQDCLYTLAICAQQAVDYRVIGSIKSIDVAPEDPQKIVALIADPAVSVVTLTVTEKGYGIAPDSGALDTSNPDIGHDLSQLELPRTTLGFLAAGLDRRRNSGGGPVAIVSCDNLPDNGVRLRGALSEFVALARPKLRGWLDENTSFPSTMVDRITPATTTADIADCRAAIGLVDEGLVRTEPFTQWVIEDNFPGSRPAWEAAGAQIVDDVEPYESAKLRLLNGPHSALGYLGYLGGYEYVHDAMQNSHYAAYIRYMMTNEISPVAPEPEGMRHNEYIDECLARFSNESLRHRTWQIAMDGSQKLPQRMLNTIRAQLKCGGSIAGISLAVAAWMRYALGYDEQGQPIDVRDPLADRFAGIAALASNDPDEIVRCYLRIAEIFGDDLPQQPSFVSTVTGQLRQLMERGAVDTVAKYVNRAGST